MRLKYLFNWKEYLNGVCTFVVVFIHFICRQKYIKNSVESKKIDFLFMVNDDENIWKNWIWIYEFIFSSSIETSLICNQIVFVCYFELWFPSISIIFLLSVAMRLHKISSIYWDEPDNQWLIWAECFPFQ